MYKYGQINIITGVCESVSYLAGEVNEPNMIALTDDDHVNPGDTYDNGVWIPAPIIDQPVGPSTEQQIADLQAQNAQIVLTLVMNDLM